MNSLAKYNFIFMNIFCFIIFSSYRDVHASRKYIYDSNGRLIRVIYDDNFSESYQYDNNGNIIQVLVDTTSTGVLADKDGRLPEQYRLYQNYPNPFNPVTMIEYHLPQASEVHLIIYDLQGHEVRELIDSKKPVGYHKVLWDGQDQAGRKVASGIYLYRIEAKTDEGKKRSFVNVKKMIFLK